MSPSDESSPEQRSRFHVETLAVVGVGLIGGSFALALKQAGCVGRVLGVGRQQQTLEQAQSLGVIDEIATLEQAARESDLLMLAAPVGAFDALFHALSPHLSDKVLITDGGSTKGNVVAAARAALGDRIGQFVPAHPIAGSHESGPQAAFADLYRNRHVVVCPLPENSSSAVTTVSDAWQACGASLVTMTVEQHDDVLAAISHLPHWLASLYVEHVARDANATLNLQLAGAGFGDFSRIAQGSVEMWRDIFMANRQSMLRQLDSLHDMLGQARDALEKNDLQWLESVLANAAQVRRDWGRQQDENKS
ncbi:MAG TPA: prephenate dehydrogenase/arogenate dehydrogenase family protein [Orrella sp.]